MFMSVREGESTAMEESSAKRVDNATRRKVNNDILEVEKLKVLYSKCKESLEAAERKVELERDNLEAITSNLEYARDALSNVQAEIDADYLPEGAQPRERINDRDRLAMVSKLIF